MRIWKRHIYCSIYRLLTLLFLGLTIQGSAQKRVSVRNFLKQDYRGESQNWSLCMDSSSFLYVANNAGLLEYDGVEWTFFPSPGGAVLRSVAVDVRGRIFTSGYRELGYWTRDEFGDLNYTSLTPRGGHLFSKNEEFWNTVIIGERVYFHSFNSLFIYEQDSFSVVRPGATIHAIAKWKDALLMHLSGLGIYRLEDHAAVPYIVDEALRENIVQFCLPMSEEALLIGTESAGLYLYSGKSLLPFLPGWKPYFSENKLNRGTLNSRGQLILGSLLDGMVVFDDTGKEVVSFNRDAGLQNNTILGLHSHGDDVWVAMDQGVSMLSLRPDPTYIRHTVPGVGAVYAAAVFKGELYLGTNQGVFYRELEQVEQAFRIIPGTQGQAWGLDVMDSQLLVSHNLGTFRIEAHEATLISPVSGGFSLTRHPRDADVLIQSTYSNLVSFGKEQGRWELKSSSTLSMI
jgi:hypothetical protein